MVDEFLETCSIQLASTTPKSSDVRSGSFNAYDSIRLGHHSRSQDHANPVFTPVPLLGVSCAWVWKMRWWTYVVRSWNFTDVRVTDDGDFLSLVSFRICKLQTASLTCIMSLRNLGTSDKKYTAKNPADAPKPARVNPLLRVSRYSHHSTSRPLQVICGAACNVFRNLHIQVCRTLDCPTRNVSRYCVSATISPVLVILVILSI